MRGDPAPRRQQGERIADCLTVGANQCSGSPGDFVEAEIARCLTAHPNRIDGESQTFIAHSLRAQAQSAHAADLETYVTHTLRGEGFDASEDGTGRGIPLIAGTLCNNGKAAGSATQQDAENGHLVVGALCRDSFSGGAGGRPEGAAAGHFIHVGGGSYPTVDQDGGAPTLTGRHGDQSGVMTGSAVRRLTPRECERLQGFPDDWTAVAYRGKRAADGPRYKALGNSMAVPVLRWIGERIQMQETSR